MNVLRHFLWQHTAGRIDEADNACAEICGDSGQTPEFVRRDGVRFHQVAGDLQIEFPGEGYGGLRLNEFGDVGADADEPGPAIRGKPKVVVVADSRNEEGAKLGLAEDPGGGQQIGLVGGGLIAFAGARRAEADAVRDLDQCDTGGFQRGCDDRGVFRGELEINGVGNRPGAWCPGSPPRVA